MGCGRVGATLAQSLQNRGHSIAVIDQNPHLEIEAALRAIAAAHGRIDAEPGPTITPLTIHMRENC